MTEDAASTGPQARREIRSIEDLLGELSPIVADSKERWYRGHDDSTYVLRASVFRKQVLRDGEQSMLDRFQQEAAAAGAPHNFDTWGWITFAQHHRLPTRLLDWSQSPLVGLYFACEKGSQDRPTDAEKDGELFVLDPLGLNNEAGDAGRGNPLLLKDNDPILDHYRPGHDASNRRKPVAVIAPMKFDRIRFQTGTFTVSQTPDPGETQPLLAQAQAVSSFTIPGDAKQTLRRQLDTLGFNEVSIYRDLDRIAERIKALHGGAS